MSDRLLSFGIDARPGFAAANLTPDIEEVVVGNVAGKDNPELVEARRRGLRVRSMPETLHDEFLLGRHPVVVAGTHGKTTTTAPSPARLGGQRAWVPIGGALNFDCRRLWGSARLSSRATISLTSYADKG
jgi:UDP-N-acetylmuramate-alanine ligase